MASNQLSHALLVGRGELLQYAAATMTGLHRRLAGGAAKAVLAASAALMLAACGVETTSPAAGTFKPRTPGVLTVVTTDVPSPGFWEGTPEHVTGGFEFELAKLLADRLGLKAVWRPGLSASRLPRWERL